MSLDLYIRSHHPVKHRGTGVFIRDNGQTRELKTVEEVKAHFPDADTSDIDIREWEDDELFHCNMTHNLTEMASHVPIEGTDGVVTLPRDYERNKPDFKPEPLSAYNLLWHPETNPLREGVARHSGRGIRQLFPLLLDVGGSMVLRTIQRAASTIKALPQAPR
jgi:hypothetical protein